MNLVKPYKLNQTELVDMKLTHNLLGQTDYARTSHLNPSTRTSQIGPDERRAKSTRVNPTREHWFGRSTRMMTSSGGALSLRL